MSLQWRIGVQDRFGSHKATLDVGHAVASLDSFALDALGSCGEASFTVIPKDVDIRPRDIVMFQTSNDGFVTHQTLYKGSVVLCGPAQGNILTQVKCAGLRGRLYETVMPLYVVPGGDVAAMVSGALTAIRDGDGLPVGVTHLDLRGSLGFLLGSRYPNLESIGAFLDAMAEAVGEFVVPTGASYIYDGRFYGPGDIVPAVRWGVNASGGLFFYRSAGSNILLDENSRRIEFEWGDITAEEFVDAPVLVYLTEFSGEKSSWRNSIGAHPLTARHPIPMSRTLGDGATNPVSTRANRVIDLANPLDFMVKATLVNGVATATPGFWPTNHWSNWSNVFDGDTNTYAEIGSGNTPAADGVSPPHGLVEGLLRLRYVAANGVDSDTAIPMNVDIEWGAWDGATWTRGPGVTWLIPVLADGIARELWIPVLRAVEYDDSAWTDILISVAGRLEGRADTLRLYEIEFWVPDSDVGGLASKAFAASNERRILGTVTDVHYQGLGPAVDTATLAPAGYAPIAGVPIERTTYSLTVDGGVVTTYSLGQAFDGNLLMQRTLLERLSQAATGVTRWRLAGGS